ncbi:MAG: histidine phosphatase family protein [Myxococcota bacterium]
MDICLIRHAEPDWMPEGRHRMDPALTDRGIEQAARLAERAENWPEVDAIWVSPALRAQQTAEPLIERLDVPVRTLDWLLEAQPTDLEGLTRAEIRQRIGGMRGRPLDEWWHGLPGGEDLRAFTKRIADGWNAELTSLGASRTTEPPHWRDLPRELRVVVVCHAGTSGASLGHLLGVEPVPWSWERFRLGHAGLVVVRSRAMSTGHIFALDRFNERDHLPRTLHTF